jgi:hypothetical protein
MIVFSLPMCYRLAVFPSHVSTCNGQRRSQLFFVHYTSLPTFQRCLRPPPLSHGAIFQKAVISIKRVSLHKNREFLDHLNKYQVLTKDVLWSCITLPLAPYLLACICDEDIMTRQPCLPCGILLKINATFEWGSTARRSGVGYCKECVTQ